MSISWKHKWNGLIFHVHIKFSDVFNANVKFGDSKIFFSEESITFIQKLFFKLIEKSDSKDI